MREHICFEAIDCDFLQYVRRSDSWVCLQIYHDLDAPIDCIRCKREKQRVIENMLRKERKSGRLL